MLSEQVSAQNEKINDLERLITDKTQHVSNTEDLLQRVCKNIEFYKYENHSFSNDDEFRIKINQKKKIIELIQSILNY